MSQESDRENDIERALEAVEKAQQDIAKAQEETVRAEEELKRATEELRRAEREHHEQKDHYPYTVDGVEYLSRESAQTGAQIKARVPNIDPVYQLVEEGKGDAQDRVIADAETVNLAVHPAPVFYLVPPATFGK